MSNYYSNYNRIVKHLNTKTYIWYTLFDYLSDDLTFGHTDVHILDISLPKG